MAGLPLLPPLLLPLLLAAAGAQQAASSGATQYGEPLPEEELRARVDALVADNFQPTLDFWHAIQRGKGEERKKWVRTRADACTRACKQARMLALLNAWPALLLLLLLTYLPPALPPSPTAG